MPFDVPPISGGAAIHAAVREAIDPIKAEAPIWKREVEGDRAEWVEGRRPPEGQPRHDGHPRRG